MTDREKANIIKKDIEKAYGANYKEQYPFGVNAFGPAYWAVRCALVSDNAEEVGYINAVRESPVALEWAIKIGDRDRMKDIVDKSEDIKTWIDNFPEDKDYMLKRLEYVTSHEYVSESLRQLFLQRKESTCLHPGVPRSKDNEFCNTYEESEDL